ncbi:MAG: DUF6580 family putative transport protein [Leptospirales bacterium]|jgi:hypothetical protein
MKYQNNFGSSAAAGSSGDTKKLFMVTAMTLVAVIVVGRLSPHAANFAPAVAAGLLAGFVFRSRWNALAVVLVGMLLSDIVIGYESLSMRAVVYASLAIPVALGGVLRGYWSEERSGLKLTAALGGSSLGSSIVFFVTTNFAVWAQGVMYEMSWAGLAACYVNAIPFFRNAILGDLAYSAALFGTYAAFHYTVTSAAITATAAKVR